jgi:site-specific recombinase XerD
MTTPSLDEFKLNYQSLLKHLRLKGLQPKTIDAYSRSIRRIGRYFDHQIDDLSVEQLLNYFSELLTTHSWSTVNLDLHGLIFYYRHVLRKPWENVDLIRPPKVKRLPDIVTTEEAAALFMATRKISYRVFFFTLYSLGLRLNEGLHLKLGDIDAKRQRVHIRDSKGNKDRLVPLPDTTLMLLRRFWRLHRNPVLLFPNRKLGLKGARLATTPMDTGGVQAAMRKIVKSSGLKKILPLTLCDTVTLPI